ncbi:MAG: signal peptidase II [Caldilineaceae bacterium SB0665_bin_21]|nr:signal peptidase II [Caldilineaceae bacterium SB0665_bin_21]MYC61271.1 signal peptidase II [Caldilineaceae bacterium SB0661_bin_34]
MIRGYLNRAWLPLLCAAIVVALDQWTKVLVREHIELHHSSTPIAWLEGIFMLEHVHNYGAAFGILQNAGILFVITTVVISIAILVSIGRLGISQRGMQVLMGLILGGAIGNFIDRMTLGYVTDFVKVGIPGKAYWPNFNIADSSIVVGVLIMTFMAWRHDIFANDEQQEEGQSDTLTLAPEASGGSNDSGV